MQKQDIMWYLSAKALPKPGSDYAKKYGGALLTCFVNVSSQVEAERTARSTLEGSGWIITAIEESHSIGRNEGSAAFSAAYQQAERNGEAYTAVTWPKGEQKDPNRKWWQFWKSNAASPASNTPSVTTDQPPGPALIVFGPTANIALTTVVAAVQSRGINAPVKTADRASQLKTYWPTPQTISPCTLIFSHYLPPGRGKPINKRALSTYQEKLQDGMGTVLGELTCQTSIEYIADVQDGRIDMVIQWKGIDSSLCVRAAEALESVFTREGGTI